MGKIKRVLGIMAILALLIGSSVPLLASISPAAAGIENPYLVRTFIDEDGNEIAEIVVPGRPPETKAAAIDVPEPDIQMGINSLTDVPAFDWSYGCSATSAAMLFGYCDRTGYSNMYAGPANGGVCPLDNSTWGVEECPLSATHMGYDGLEDKGHVDDYWVAYGSSEPDPWIGNWLEHTHADCTGDFMGTNQSSVGNTDGSTTFYYYTNGEPLEDFTDYEPGVRDGCHGLRLFAESRGYSVVTNFSQYIDELGLPYGFTFAQYMAEIDAGRPVLIQVEGHTMLGYGYNTEGNKVYIHDTWDYLDHEMVWGELYSGLQHYGVTVIQLEPLAAPTEVWVDDDYTPGGDNDGHAWGYDAFDSIQDGIDAVNGSTVHVAEGNYEETIVLIDGVEVLGAGAEVTTIDALTSFTVVTAIGVGETTRIDGFTITNGLNTYGGGMYIESASPVVSNCIFIDNDADEGGGMYIGSSSSPTVTNCFFVDNYVESVGGGILNVDSDPTVTNCLFFSNGSGEGGGMYNANSTPVVTNCTFYDNWAVQHGGGMYNYDSSPIVTNCILWSDDGGEIYDAGTSAPVVTYCDVEGEYPGDGNINADPLFADAVGGDFHLTSESPCIDAGDNTAVPEWLTTDFEGDDRIINEVVDMGFDEYEAYGLLRVQTDPPVTTTIFIDDFPRNGFGLDWVKMPVGTYMLSFSDVPGFATPTTVEVTYYPGGGPVTHSLSEPIEILADTTTEVIVSFTQLGALRVETSPALAATIFVDGYPMNDWGCWVYLEPGEYTVSFQDIGYGTVPPPIEVTVTAGATTHVIGDYDTGESYVVT